MAETSLAREVVAIQEHATMQLMFTLALLSHFEIHKMLSVKKRTNWNAHGFRCFNKIQEPHNNGSSFPEMNGNEHSLGLGKWMVNTGGW